jgi:hypothetical protein
MKRFLLLMSGLVVAVELAANQSPPLIFSGMCDASAAVALDGDLFAVGCDEDNFLRFYRVSQPGKPVHIYNLNPFLFGKKKSPEADLEGAARLGSRIYWVTSHGQNAEGRFAPNRHQFFALEVNLRGGVLEVRPVGRPYTNLLSDLVRDPRLERYQLAEAARRAPKASGGLNIEALTDTREGNLLIGFRNPIPGGRALMIPLLNPGALLEGTPASFGEPLLLDLGGKGLRGMGSTGSGYYLIAGPAGADAESQIFFWEGNDLPPKPIAGRTFPGLNLEGLCFHDSEARSDFLILSDDGSLMSSGKECKSLPEDQRRFRAFRLAH